MSHSQTVSAGEDMAMEQKGSPKESGDDIAQVSPRTRPSHSQGESEQAEEVEETNELCATETQNQRQTDGTQNSNSDEIERQERFHYLNSCVLLYQAAFKGNWQKAKALLGKYPDIVRKPISKGEDTALHIAAAANHPNFVKELLKLMEKEDLELQNKQGQTALYFAAASGNVIMAEEMVEKNDKDKLTLIGQEATIPEEMVENNDEQSVIGHEATIPEEGVENNDEPSVIGHEVTIPEETVENNDEPSSIRREKIIKYTPLYIAALLGRREMVSYLFGVTPFEDLSADDRIQLFVATISNDLFDIALRIMKKDARLATAKDINGETALYALATSQLFVSKTPTLARQLVEDLWREVRLLPEKQFFDHVKPLLFEAAKMGNAELLIIVIRSYPDLIWTTDKKWPSIFHIAVLYRQETVFNLIYEIGAFKDMILTYTDGQGQNILHLAGKLAPPSRLYMVSGAAFQMQREILWFKEVERLVTPSYKNMKSCDRNDVEGLTPWDLFTREHKDLRAEGEKWMKDTVNFYIVVATLISTVAFAAVITVPGGSNQDKGTPILLKGIWFRVFFISNAIALLFSSASIIIYLSILTSRFAEVDFRVSLPLKGLLGIITLVISIVGMVVAFSATCFLVWKSELTWLPVVIIALAGVLIISLVSQHCQLLFGIIHSASLSKSLFGKPKNRLFY